MRRRRYYFDLAITATFMSSYNLLPCEAFVIPAKHSSSLPNASELLNPTRSNRFPTIFNPSERNHDRDPHQPAHSLNFITSSSSSSSFSSTELHGTSNVYQWFTNQYPNVISQLSEVLINEKVVDNFYLDMNEMIEHACTNGNSNDEIIILDETAMFEKIFLYVDRLYKIVRPQKLLYLAIDGVAPRAKLNQQRLRRYQSSQKAEKLAAKILARDGELPQGEKFDSNCITPGTDFMLKLSTALKKWIKFKQMTDPFWKNGADVVFSGPDVCGEGEHKVMDYIRECKAQYDEENPENSHPHWKPELTHVLYGLDADLILLGLVTHEPNFMLLREKMSVLMAGRVRRQGRHMYKEKKKDMLEYTRDDFELLELQVLREMFQIQFRKLADEGSFGSKYDLNRIIDDFVFMRMLVGNDFLPHCPHLDIHDLSLLLSNYIDLLPEWGGYLTNKEKIHSERFEQFIYHMGVFEQGYFKNRAFNENERGWLLSSDNEIEEDDFFGKYYGDKPTPDFATRVHSAEGALQYGSRNDSGDKSIKHEKGNPRSYRDFYYGSKMGWSHANRVDTLTFRRAHVRDYLEGLHWVLYYYHKGCPSFNWYFPHLYSPLSTDMVNLNEFYREDSLNTEEDEDGFKTLSFESTEPFPSLAHLLSVLPPQSSSLLPKSLGELMVHPSSPIIEFYPPEFTTDQNEKWRALWKVAVFDVVVQIPFIDGDKLLDVVNSVMAKDDSLTTAERKRNERGRSETYVPERENGALEAVYPPLVETALRRMLQKRRGVGSARSSDKFVTDLIAVQYPYCDESQAEVKLADIFYSGLVDFYLNKIGIPEGVSIVDDAIPKHLHDDLMQQIDDFARSNEVDYHPHSNDIVRDLVHPSLYPYVKGVSPVEYDMDNVTPYNLTFDHKQEEQDGKSDIWGRQYEASLKYQFLPTYFDIDKDGKCKICDYINNLVPRSQYTDLYSSLEKLFSHALPQLEYVFSYGCAAANLLVNGYHFQYRLSSPGDNPKFRSLRKERLQVVTKIVDYELGPGDSYEGVWHVEGMSHEEIVATAIYFLHRDEGIDGGNIAFKRAFFHEESERIKNKFGQDDRTEEQESLILDGLVPLGQVETRTNRLLVFPNSHVHKVFKFQNTCTAKKNDHTNKKASSSTKQRHRSDDVDEEGKRVRKNPDHGGKKRRRIVVFFLINPCKRIISTREVKPQQIELGGMMSRAEAMKHRLELMKERKYTKQDWNVREISLCEH